MSLFEQTPEEVALDLIKQALAEEVGPSSTTQAENLHAILRHYDFPLEVLLRWIHTPALGKQWTAAEFRRFCEKLEAERRQFAEEAELRLPPHFPA